MTGFEPGSSGIGSDRSANCATTTAQSETFYFSSLKWYNTANSFPFSTFIKVHGMGILNMKSVLQYDASRQTNSQSQ